MSLLFLLLLQLLFTPLVTLPYNISTRIFLLPLQTILERQKLRLSQVKYLPQLPVLGYGRSGVSELCWPGPCHYVWLWWCLPILCGGPASSVPRTTYSEQKANAVLCCCHFSSALLPLPGSPLSRGLILRGRLVPPGEDQNGRWGGDRGRGGDR